MSINLSKTLKAKQAESNLSIDALAKAIGVSTVSIRGVLAGKSKPNATTAKKYADFLGVDIAALAGPKTAKTPKAAKAAKADKADKADKAEGKVAKVKGKPGRKPGRKAGKSASAGLGADLVRVATAAADLLDDEIALAVHVAGKSERDLIARILAIG
jgi:transcriptional regulator with XRE-family HTH domain